MTIGVVAVAALLAGFVVRHVLGALIAQEVKGTVPVVAAARVRRAARLLPDELAEEYESTWLAELATLRERPLKSLHFSRSLPLAARLIAAEAGSPVPLSRGGRVRDRGLDLAVGSLLLLALSPLLAAIATAVRLTTRGPVILSTPRYGRNGERFGLLRYRTIMVVPGDDPRISAIGAVLRRLELHRLAGLVNVLKGELSLVGPQAAPVLGPAPPVESLPIRPGLISWADLADARHLTHGDAHTRDHDPRLRTKMALVGRWWWHLRPHDLPGLAFYASVTGVLSLMAVSCMLAVTMVLVGLVALFL